MLNFFISGFESKNGRNFLLRRDREGKLDKQRKNLTRKARTIIQFKLHGWWLQPNNIGLGLPSQCWALLALDLIRISQSHQRKLCCDRYIQLIAPISTYCSTLFSPCSSLQMQFF